LRDWTLNTKLDMAEIVRMGQEWKEYIPGQASADGSAEAYFIGTDSFFDALEEAAEGTELYFMLELFNYDPDQDQTGDHFLAWATIDGVNVNAPIGDTVKEPVTFKVHGIPSFVANA